MKQRNTKNSRIKSLSWSIKQNLWNHPTYRWCWHWIYFRPDKLAKVYQFCATNRMYDIHWTANSSKSSHLFVWRTVINANFRCLNWILVLCCSFWSKRTLSLFALIVGDVAIAGIAWRILDRSWAQAEKTCEFDTTFATHDWPSVNRANRNGWPWLWVFGIRQTCEHINRQSRWTKSIASERNKEKSSVSNGISFEIVFFLNAVCDTTFCLLLG